MGRDREFDIIVWGATGFVGRLAARQLAARSRNGSDVRWAIGGRTQAKLEHVRSGLGPEAADIPIITGDSHDTASMQALAERASVVCSCVGPYAKYGSELVAACARSGTHYCDLAAEAHWIRRMIDDHAVEAERTGALLVHACGMDSIPSDLGVAVLQGAARERFGRPCSRVRMRVTELTGGFSGGTAAAMLHGFEAGRDDPAIRQGMTEPYFLCPDGQREGPEPLGKMMSVSVEYDEDLRAWTKPFFMGPMNTKIVRRTNAILDYPYGQDFRYEEARLVGDGWSGRVKAQVEALGFGAFGVAVAIPPTRRLLKRYVLPAPGEGPSQEVVERGHWEIILVGKHDEGGVIKARVAGEGDPSAMSSSRMLIESALCLLQDGDRISVGGGSWTPESALGEPLLARLTSHAGLTFEVQD
jgi:short subunit dehydrogenase-like uncharacterized protein